MAKTSKNFSDIPNGRNPFPYLFLLYKRFQEDQCSAWAASLSFFAILSIPAVLLCALAVLGAVIEPGEAATQVQSFFARVLPGDPQTTAKQAANIMEQLKIVETIDTLRRQSGWAGFIGVVSLFWSATNILLSAVPPMNAAFRAKETRNYIILRLTALLLLFAIGALFLASLLPSAGVQVLNSLRLPFLVRLPDPSPWWLQALLILIGSTINGLMFTLLYRFLPSPSAKVPARSALFAGIVVAILWEAAKQLFALYLQWAGNASYSKIYGAFASVVALIFWIHYTSLLLLLGAEIAELHSDILDRNTALNTPPAPETPSAPKRSGALPNPPRVTLASLAPLAWVGGVFALLLARRKK